MLGYVTHPRLRVLFFLIGIFILLGVVIFTTLENWSIIDALYYTVATITTVGYGDITPTNPASRLLATFYMMMTVPMILISVGLTTEIVHDNVRKRDAAKKRV